jgi:mRNA interferase RelE/StbE
MSYQVVIPKPVEKQLDALPEVVRRAVLLRLSTLKDTPRPHGCVKLKGYDDEYRLRVGDYRIRYQILDQEKVVVILHCLNRKDVYRR